MNSTEIKKHNGCGKYWKIIPTEIDEKQLVCHHGWLYVVELFVQRSVISTGLLCTY